MNWFPSLFTIVPKHLDLAFWMVLLFIEDLPVPSDIFEHPILMTIFKLPVDSMDDLVTKIFPCHPQASQKMVIS